MKKVFMGIVALLLVLAMTTPALAMKHKTMYATQDKVKVYLAPDTSSKVVLKLEKGKEITAVDKTDDGKWYGFYPPDDSYGICWVQKNTSAPKSPATTNGPSGRS